MAKAGGKKKQDLHYDAIVEAPARRLSKKQAVVSRDAPVEVDGGPKVGSFGGEVPSDARLLKRPSAAGDIGTRVTDHLLLSSYSKRDFVAEFAPGAETQGSIQSDVRQRHLMYCKLAVLVERGMWDSAHAAAAARELCKLKINRNKAALHHRQYIEALTTAVPDNKRIGRVAKVTEGQRWDLLAAIKFCQAANRPLSVNEVEEVIILQRLFNDGVIGHETELDLAKMPFYRRECPRGGLA